MVGERCGGIGLADYAETVAYLRAAPPDRSGEILARRGLTTATWQAAAGAWAQAIEEEMARGEHRLLLAYAAAVQAARQRLATDPEAISKIEKVATGNDPREPPITTEGVPPLRPIQPVGAAALASTAPLDVQAILSRGLPFARSLDPAAAVGGFPPAVRVPRTPTGTKVKIETRAAAALPFAPGPGASAEAGAAGGAAPRDPEMSLEQYVALCAEITVFPARAEAILARASIPQSALAGLHAAWRERFAADAALAGRWHVLYAHYQSWFAKTP